jgi:hypothetical protein
MGHLTIYLPDDVERRVRSGARARKKSVSAYIAAQFEPVKRGKNGWPIDFINLYGSLKKGAIKEMPREVTEPPNFDDPIPPRHKRRHRVSSRR